MFGGHDNYTINPRDAGMRLVLPGPTDVLQAYFVRVYSKNAVETGNPSPAPFTLGAGDTRGYYQLQLRLQEADEVPGSTVQFSDIRFATNGIEAIGLPGNSPLIGDTGERANDTGNEGQAGALNVGNVLQSDAGSLSIAGALATATDVDWYQFTLDHDLIQPENGLRTISMIFDIDYADGIGRPDTVISVFNAQGQLVLVSRDSDVADDQVGPTPETGPSDLSRGSFGKLDAYIGPQQLPAGSLQVPGVSVPGQSRTYFVAVSSNGTLPTVLNLTFQGAATNETVKLEPVNSVQRIAEDHIGFSGSTAGVQSAAVDAFGRPLTEAQINPTSQLFDISTPLSLQANVKPFTLEDVPLFVSSPFDGFNLFTINAATGGLETTYQLDFNDFGYIDPVEDITFRSDGRLFGYASGLSQGNFQNTAGRVFEVDLTDGSPIPFGNDSIPDNVLLSFQVDALAIIKTRFPAPGNPASPRWEQMFMSVQDSNFFSPQSHLAIANESANANVPNNGFTVIGPIFETSPGDIGITTGLATRLEPFTDVTGAQFFTENLYGVTDQGHFVLIEPFFFGPGPGGAGLATVLATIPGMQFAGLTPGPQNLDFNQDGVFGDLADTFFAITVDGTLVAIEVESEPQRPVLPYRPPGRSMSST